MCNSLTPEIIPVVNPVVNFCENIVLPSATGVGSA